MNSDKSKDYRFKILLSITIVLCASILNREFILSLVTAYIAEHDWLFFISQVAVAALGVPAIFVSQSLSRSTNRWASVLGLCGQLQTLLSGINRELVNRVDYEI